MTKQTFDEARYPDFHGSPFDRGSADSYYRRSRDPHWWPNGTGSGKMVEATEMSEYELEAYHAGYDENEAAGIFKKW